MKTFLRTLTNWIIRLIGQPLFDPTTQQNLGKFILLPLPQPLALFTPHFPYVKPTFLPQKSVKYDRYRLGFASHPPVNFKRLVHPPPPTQHPNILWVILLHQSPSRCQEILALWQSQNATILPLHGGNPQDSSGLIHLPDLCLRTKNHPAEKQSYRSVWQTASRWMQGKNFTHVCFAESDHIPLIDDLGQRLVASLNDADVCFHFLCRVDGTNAPHYLHHLSDPLFAANPWNSMSLRENPEVVLNALATGSCWTRQAFDTVANSFPQVPIYLEMDLPTTAHHLGFRVVEAPPPSRQFIHVKPFSEKDFELARSRGAWSIHPVKFPVTPHPSKMATTPPTPACHPCTTPSQN